MKVNIENIRRFWWEIISAPFYILHDLLQSKSFFTWAIVTLLVVGKYITMDGMSYAMFTVGILGVKTWKKVTEIKGAIK